MSTKIIPHIYGSIISLEKSIALAVENNVALPSKDLPKIISEMKKVAQLIQLQFARNDNENATRSLKLFYGLLSMIRPLVIDTLQSKPVRRKKDQVANLH